MTPLTSNPSSGLSGNVEVPGDKSISHRALILGALSVGETVIQGLLEAGDVKQTAAALSALGTEIVRDDSGLWHVHGRGIGGLSESTKALDLGNSGTGLRLLMGVVATHPITTFFIGDISLSQRPMGRVAQPLEMMGAKVIARSGTFLPLVIEGTSQALPIAYTLPVPSAQLKSAVLLASLNAPGKSSVLEPEPTRDHTERMLARFGAEIYIEEDERGSRISLIGQPELQPIQVTVPGDISSAAFIIVAGLIVPNSEITIQNVGINPRRRGLIDCLLEMGASIDLESRSSEGEEIADITVHSSSLEGIDVPPEYSPSMIDEYPILAVAASVASGTTTLRGLCELRLKESDRLSSITEGLIACGVKVEQNNDDLIIYGCGSSPPGGATVATNMDHRIAMAFIVLALASRKSITVNDSTPIATSFPNFIETLSKLGAQLTETST